MATVADVLSPSPITVETTATVREAAELMREHDVGDLVVVEQGRLVGIVTDRDLVVRVLAVGGGSNDPVGQVATGSPVVVGPDDDLVGAARLMATHAVRRLPVVCEGEVVGVLSLGDLAVRHNAGPVLGAISQAPASS
ncbi:CBS domain-containing protein YhcV [Cellulomonas algicola]|uniref:CBS domain-containing protein YhcV n=1 Tax=Cellulomonas algicola TaxID=2071633 RepID=A0A401UZU2_9CELL|nr:CBS domain-containing protein [Cellulomonas algicola]GCD20124.1 CBS domain-containing protein YhcV [Cellulomonas algicola]